MGRDTSKFTIREKDLAQALEISVQRLDEIISFFDSDPNDEWDLRESDHFIYSNKQWKERVFSQHGAYAIAKYMDSIEKKSIWELIVEFITKHKEKIRNAFVRQKIYENSSSLLPRGNTYFLSKKDIVGILCTSYARLNKAFSDLRRCEKPLEKGKDFDDIEGKRYYSLSGLYRISQLLSRELTVRDRREWCKSIDVVGRKTFKLITSDMDRVDAAIKKAKSDAKKRDKKRCQITGEQAKKGNKFNVAAHHIFSVEHYSQLATVLQNIITLKEEVHHEFHIWNGGTKAPCTVDDLIQFVIERYPEQEEVLQKLYKVKKILGNPTPATLPKIGTKKITGQNAA